MSGARPPEAADQAPSASEWREEDGHYLRLAIAMSAAGSARGNRPFGAVVVSATGQVLAQAHNDNAATGDCTAHAEVNALRQLRREAMAGATIYASGEPCVMCAGAIFWSGIRRVVFGIDAVRLRRFRAAQPGAADLQMSCRDVFAASAEPFTVIGPAMIDEAIVPHQHYWNIP